MKLSHLKGVKFLKKPKIQFLNKNSDFVHIVDLEKGLKLYNDILFGEFYCLLRSKNGWCIYLDCIWWQAWRWTLFEVCSEILVYMLKHQIKWHLPFTSLPMANVQESKKKCKKWINWKNYSSAKASSFQIISQKMTIKFNDDDFLCLWNFNLLKKTWKDPKVNR